MMYVSQITTLYNLYRVYVNYISVRLNEKKKRNIRAKILLISLYLVLCRTLKKHYTNICSLIHSFSKYLLST